VIALADTFANEANESTLHRDRIADEADAVILP
jgi:hypothetical protein